VLPIFSDHPLGHVWRVIYVPGGLVKLLLKELLLLIKLIKLMY
jgi:hypothetical protein